MSHIIETEEGVSKVVVPEHDPLFKDDQDAMNTIGKASALPRRFGFWSALAMTVCVSGTWAGVGAVSITALTLGGPVDFLYGFILVAFCSACEASALAELSSIWPSAGSQYHWASELAPPRFRAFASWTAGWLAFAFAWVGTVSASIAVALQIQSYIIVSYPSYVAERWHVFMLHVLNMVLAVIINIYGIGLFHFLNMGGMIVHVVGYFVIMIVLLACTDVKNSTEYVFTSWTNYSGWPSDNLAFCIGLLTPLFGFVAIETAAHFSEEIRHVRKSVPRAMVLTVCINGVVTVPWLIVILYCMSLDSILASPIALSSPLTQIFIDSTNNIGASIFLTCLTTYIGFCGAVNSLGSCSRTMWAMARDRALPQVFTRLSPKFDVPVYTILTCAVPQALLGLIYIGNTTAFYGIVSGTLILMHASYGLPIALHLLYARRHKAITYGPWNLGRLSVPINALSFCWVIFIMIFLSFPQAYPVTPENMNYAVVILAFVLLACFSGYFFYARGRFTGPIVEIEIQGTSLDTPKAVQAPTNGGNALDLVDSKAPGKVEPTNVSQAEELR